MRLALLTGILGMFLLGDGAIAEEVKEKAPVGIPGAVAQKEKAGVIHHINTDVDDGAAEPTERPEDYEGQELPSYESYDPNTGLTDETQSDAAGNLN